MADELEKVKPIKSITFVHEGRGSRHEYDKEGKFVRHVSLVDVPGDKSGVKYEYYEN